MQLQIEVNLIKGDNLKNKDYLNSNDELKKEDNLKNEGLNFCIQVTLLRNFSFN